jgi:hypothetical protein
VLKDDLERCDILIAGASHLFIPTTVCVSVCEVVFDLVFEVWVALVGTGYLINALYEEAREAHAFL